MKKFKQYHKERVHCEGVRDWINAARGRGKTNLGSHLGVGAARGIGDVAGAVGSASKVASAGIGLLAGGAKVLAGDVSGGMGDIFGFIKSITSLVKVVTGSAEVGKAGVQIYKVYRHKDGLIQHLAGQGVDEGAIKEIIEAVFEVDREVAAIVPPIAWADAVTSFVSGLDGGYDGIENKIFSKVLYDAIQKAFQGLGGRAQELAASVQKNLQVVKMPEVQQVLQSYDPSQYQPSEAMQALAKGGFKDEAGEYDKDIQSQHKQGFDQNPKSSQIGDNDVPPGGFDRGNETNLPVIYLKEADPEQITRQIRNALPKLLAADAMGGPTPPGLPTGAALEKYITEKELSYLVWWYMDKLKQSPRAFGEKMTPMDRTFTSFKLDLNVLARMVVKNLATKAREKHWSSRNG